jgi:hypothetical protein
MRVNEEEKVLVRKIYFIWNNLVFGIRVFITLSDMFVQTYRAF